MRRVLNIIMMLAIVAGTCHAQHGPQRFSPEKFRADLEKFITGEVGFTHSEAQKFYPLYHEMKDKQRDVQHKIFELKKNIKPDADDKEYANAIQSIIGLNKQKNELEEDYYKKMCKAVPAKKVYRAMLAEDKFHRKMLNRIDQKQRNLKQRDQQQRKKKK